MYRTLRIGRLTIAYNDPHDLLGILEVFALDIYGLESVPEGAVVLDVGAGVGDFSLAASAKVGPRGLVVAVEPNPADFATFQQNLRTNHIGNVVPYNLAASDGSVDVPLRFKGARYTAKSAPLVDVLASLRASRPGLQRLGFVKMDVEGLEARAIRGLGEELDSVKTIAIELHNTRPQVDGLLIPMGFSFAPLTRAHYLGRASRFAVQHPVATASLWRKTSAAGLMPGLGKLLRGIDIVRGEELLVGTYVR